MTPGKTWDYQPLINFKLWHRYGSVAISIWRRQKKRGRIRWNGWEARSEKNRTYRRLQWHPRKHERPIIECNCLPLLWPKKLNPKVHKHNRRLYFSQLWFPLPKPVSPFIAQFPLSFFVRRYGSELKDSQSPGRDNLEINKLLGIWKSQSMSIGLLN